MLLTAPLASAAPAAVVALTGGMATDMLEALPPAGLPDLATRDDVALVRADMRTMEARLRLEIADRSSQSLRVIVAVVAVATALLGLLVTLA